MWTYLLRALLPGHNPIGFGPADFLELALAALLVVAAVLWRPFLEPLFGRFAQRTLWCMLLLAISPVALRLLLLKHHPVPTPDVYDEFSHLLVADTLRHLRLANPPLAMPQFFETFFVLQQPAYSSIYPLGQGLAMALGWSLFGLPWAGVLMAVAALSSLSYWMLRGWTTPGWALLGGVFAVIEFGPFNTWTNSYWGGALAAAAGCLVFGALPRLRASSRVRDAVLLGAGLGLHLLIRQFESIFLFLAVALYFPPVLRVRPNLPAARLAGVVAVALLPAVLLTLLQNRAGTGNWTTVPERLSQMQYGVPAALTFQPNPVPQRELTPQQAMDYQMQLSFSAGPETLATWLQRLEYRVRFYRFFFFPPLYLAAAAFLASLREYRFVWVALTLAIFACGTNFFPAFQFHYVAAVTCLFLLVAVTGLRQIARISIHKHPAGQEAAGLIVFLCVAQFLFWYGMHLADDQEFSRDARQYEVWDSLNHQNPARRIAVANELAKIPGKILVFVRYLPQHIFQDEWVYNRADLDTARVVWARDLGPEEDAKLLHAYPDRTVFLLEPDARPPQLSRYQPHEDGR
ncbi:MAG TPA: hypothetical protein VMH81_28590 [Bryobacteraceae bacterium]|nr:hypothetical protein [Bryobacteraceae bacterium]